MSMAPGYLAAALWVIGFVLWPVPSNLRMREGERLTASAGEGLYKSDITRAGFGLLGVRFFESTGGEKSWKIRSEFAELHRQKENYAFMKTVDADFFAGPSRNVVHTKSDYGRSHFGKRLVELEGNVIVQSEQGYRFTMDRLDYDSAIHHFRSNEIVHMTGPNVDNPQMFLTGMGLDADLNEESFVVLKDTQARRRLGNNQWMKLQSVRGVFQPQRKRAVFSQRVRAVLPLLTIESDRLEMSVGEGESEYLHAEGRVVLYHKDRKGRSEMADIEVANDKVVLEGRASIVSPGDDELRGKRITLYTDEDRVEVEQAEGGTKE